MPDSYQKNILRTFRSTKSRFIAIFSIVALGVGFLAGLMSTTPDMKDSMERYLDAANLYDIRLVSTLGLTGDDAAALAAVEGIAAVQPGYSLDLLVQRGEDTLVARAQSLPPEGEAALNRLTLVEGRWPEAPGECVVDAGVLGRIGGSFALGESFTVSPENGDLSDSLPGSTFTAVGLVRSGAYFSIEREAASVGDGSVALLFYVPASEFSYEAYTEIYLAVDGARALPSLEEAYQTLVDAAVERLEGIEGARCQARRDGIVADARKELDDGWAEYNDAKAEADDAFAEAEAKLDDARRKLADGEAQYADGLAALRENEQAARDGRAQLESGRAELQRRQGEYDDGVAQMAAGRAELENGRAQYTAGVAALAAALAEQGLAVTPEQLSQAIDALAALPAGQLPEDPAELTRLLLEQLPEVPLTPDTAAQVRALLQQLLDSLPGGGAALGQPPLPPGEAPLPDLPETLPDLPETLPDLPETLPDVGTDAAAAWLRGELERLLALSDEELLAELQTLLEALRGLPADQLPEEYRQLLEALEEALRQQSTPEQQEQLQQLAGGVRELVDARRQLLSGEAELAAGEAALAEGGAQLADGWAALAASERQLADGEKQLAEGRAELADAWQEILDGRAELADGEAEYEQERADAEAELADARQELEDAEADLAALEAPEWYIQDRAANTSFNSFKGNVSKVEAIARVFPIFFFLVAALVVSTTMTRMVEEERLQIGTMKAMGYARRTIMKKYVLYALTAAVLGALAGLALGFAVFPSVIWYAYEMMYYMPGISTPWRANYALAAGGLLIGCALVATLSACRVTLRETPAALMRPRAPKAGKRILLEHITFLWRRLPFTYKVTCRNLLRYKKRFWMTVIGVAGCTALLVTGFGISDSLNGIALKQYGQIYRYDLLTGVTDAEKTQAGPVHDYLFGDAAFAGSLAASTELVKQQMPDGSYAEVYLMTPQHAAAFADFADLHERVSRRPTPLAEDGVVLTEKLAATLGVGAGDTVTLENGAGARTAFRVSGVCEHYVMNYAYIGAAAYEKGFGAAPEYNTVLSLLSDDSPAGRAAVSAALLKMEGVGAVNFTTDQMDAVLNMLRSINAVVVLIIVCAASLAFVVLYNLTNINIAERVKEIATIKVLGFYDREVSAYVNRESVVLTVIGALLGLLGGIALHKFVIYTVEVDAVMFGRDIAPMSFVYAFALTMLFSLAVNLFMGRKLKRISMVESMKAPE